MAETGYEFLFGYDPKLILVLLILLLFVNSSLMVPPSEGIFLVIGLVSANFGIQGVILATVSGALSNLLGTTLWYYIGKFSGNGSFKRSRLLYHAIEFSDFAFRRLGRSSVFWLRLIPAIRSIISFPAGRAKMPLAYFLTLTFLGMLVWGSIWTSLGAYARTIQNKNGLVVVLFLFVIVAIVYHRIVKEALLYVLRRRKG